MWLVALCFTLLQAADVKGRWDQLATAAGLEEHVGQPPEQILRDPTVCLAFAATLIDPPSDYRELAEGLLIALPGNLRQEVQKALQRIPDHIYAPTDVCLNYVHDDFAEIHGLFDLENQNGFASKCLRLSDCHFHVMIAAREGLFGKGELSEKEIDELGRTTKALGYLLAADPDRNSVEAVLARIASPWRRQRLRLALRN